jgi:hypothetical protein
MDTDMSSILWQLFTDCEERTRGVQMLWDSLTSNPDLLHVPSKDPRVVNVQRFCHQLEDKFFTEAGSRLEYQDNVVWKAIEIRRAVEQREFLRKRKLVLLQASSTMFKPRSKST